MEVREAMRRPVDVQIVRSRLAGRRRPPAPNSRALLRDAIAPAPTSSAAARTSTPTLAPAPPRAHVARRRARRDPVDLHTDETLDPERAAACRPGRAGGGDGLPAPGDGQPLREPRRAAGGRAGARSPRRSPRPASPSSRSPDQPVPPGPRAPGAEPRGLTALRALRDAGVDVAAGADNLQDPFNPSAGPTRSRRRALMVMAATCLPADAFRPHRVGRRALAPEPVAVEPGRRPSWWRSRAATVRGRSPRPGGRLTIHRGRVVAESDRLHGVRGAEMPQAKQCVHTRGTRPCGCRRNLAPS